MNKIESKFKCLTGALSSLFRANLKSIGLVLPDDEMNEEDGDDIAWSSRINFQNKTIQIVFSNHGKSNSRRELNFVER